MPDSSSLLKLPPAVTHGSVSASELASWGLSLEDVTDFSVNTNPLGPAPNVLAAVSSTDWTRYPGDDEPLLRSGLAARHALSEDGVALGNGSVELLWLIVWTLLKPGDGVAILGPTFGEYERAAALVGARVETHTRPEQVRGARLGILCNPNNPSGRLWTAQEVACAYAGVEYLLVDEAYMSLVADGARWTATDLLDQLPRLVVLRSLTKDQAIPGLRLGYALAQPPLARLLEAARPPWSVNAGALRAGLAALEPAARAHVRQARSEVNLARSTLTAGLCDLGLTVHPSEANFLLLDVGSGRDLRQALLQRGFVLRDCASFGLPRCVRIACRRVDDCQSLLSALKALKDEGGLP